LPLALETCIATVHNDWMTADWATKYDMDWIICQQIATMSRWQRGKTEKVVPQITMDMGTLTVSCWGMTTDNHCVIYAN